MKVSISPQSLERYAVRILFILYFCKDFPPSRVVQLQLPFDSSDDAWWIDSETKLQKIDFWIRYPDHLAAALLTGVETDGNLAYRRDDVKQIIRQIFQNQEPTLRWVPMYRYLHGAYEPLDKVMIYLTSRSLAYRRIEERGHRTKYYLPKKGQAAVEAMLRECPETSWYATRCQLINSYFEHLNGFEIRKLQYLHGSYAETPYMATIEKVEAEVYSRFDVVFGEPL